MRVASAQQLDSLAVEIEKRFTAFNEFNASTNRKRHYPNDLRQLVCQAGARGMKVLEICRLSGLAPSVVHGWLAKSKALKGARQLEVISLPLPSNQSAAVSVPIPAAAQASKPAPPPASAIVHLPSGVTIEFADSRALDSHLLRVLADLGVNHATSC